MTLQQILALPQDRMLTNIAIEYRPRPDALVADRVLPVIPVNLEQGGYYTFDDGNFSIPEMKRNPRAVYKEIDFGMSSDTYRADEYGIETRIDDRERKNAPNALSLDVQKTRRVTNAGLLNRERRVANLVTSTTNVPFNTTLVGAAQWSDPSSDPAIVSRTARNSLRNKTGVLPNRLTMGWNVYEALRVNPFVKDYMDGGRASEADLAEYFEVEEVIVARAVYNSANEGQTSTLVDLWGNDALFHFQSAIQSADEPSFGYQFEAQGPAIFRYRDVKVNCDIIRYNEIRAEKIASTRLAYLVKNAVTPL